MNRFHLRNFVCAGLLSLIFFPLPGFSQGNNDSRLLELAISGETQAARELISRNTDVNQAQSDGTTLLHWAIYHNDEDLVRLLLRRGADVSARNDYGATPLSQATIIGNPDVIKRLLDADADPDEKGADDQTPIMIIARTEIILRPQKYCYAPVPM